MAKIGHHAKAIAFAKSSLWLCYQKQVKTNCKTSLELFSAKTKKCQKWYFGSKIKIVKNTLKTTLEPYSNCCVQKKRS